MMQWLFMVCGALYIVAAAVFIWRAKTAIADKVAVGIYGTATAFYLFLCAPSLQFLMDSFTFAGSFTLVNTQYVQVSVTLITLLAGAAAILTMISPWIHDQAVRNRMSNIYLLISLSVTVCLLLLWLFLNQTYQFLIMFLPAHFLLPNALLAPALLDFSLAVHRVKALILYTLLAIACVVAAVLLVLSALRFSFLNAYFFLLFGCFVILFLTGYITAYFSIFVSKK